MTHIFTKMGGGSSLLILFLFLAPDTFAQDNLYVDLATGSGSECLVSEPCSLTQALSNVPTDGTIYIRVRRSGHTVTFEEDYGPLNVAVNFAAYVRGSTDATDATLEFTGEFELGESGKFIPHKDITALFTHLVVSDGNDSPFGDDSENLGSITISTLEAGFVTFPRLEVTSDLMVKRLETATSSSVVTVKELEVQEGATLTVGVEENIDGSDRDNPVHLRVPLRQATNAEAKFDNLVVDGVIDGAGSLLIVHDNRAGERGASGMNLHVTEDYTPTGDKRMIDHTDCVTIEGDGEIHTDLYAVAAGNICVTLKKIGRLIVGGSIQSDAYTAEMITTDVIFREDVEIMGDVEQWNDAKIKFEKKSTIDGSVILDSGEFSYPVLTAAGTGSNSITIGDPRDNFDKTATSGGDLIVRSASRNNDESCWPTRRATGRTIEDGVIPGVRFEGPTTIADDLDLRHVFDNRDHEGTGLTDTGAAQRCLIAVDFWVLTPGFGTSLTEGQALTSRISGDILAQNGGSINLFGGFRIQFAPDFSSSSTYYFNHHLELDGDIFAEGEFGLSIWEGNSTRYDSYDGSCASTDGMPDALTLTGSSQLVLTNKREHTIRLGDGNMRIFSLSTHEKVEVEGGTLITKAIHVQDGGELVSDENIQVGWSDTSIENTYWAASRFRANPYSRGRLILEGDGLDGQLHADSYVRGLTYAATRTDQVDANLIRAADRHVVFHFDSNRYMRLSNTLVTEHAGLCSGTVILEEPDEDDAKTLIIHDNLYVGDGVFEFDTNRAGSLGTDDKNKDPDQLSYVLTYETDGERTIGNEWFGTPRNLVIDHDKSVITSDESRKLPGRLRVMGQFHVNGTLTVGTDSKIQNTSWSTRNCQSTRARLDVCEEALLRADTIRVHDRMTVYGTVKTEGGDIYSLGRTDEDGHYVDLTSEVYIRGKKGMIDLGEGGTLHLGPPLTKKQDGLISPAGENGMPSTAFSALNSEAKQPFKGNLNVTSGSKFNSVQFIPHIDTLTFDGTATPNLSPVSTSNKRNVEGIVFIQNHTVSNEGVTTLVDSLHIDKLSAQNGWVRFWNTPHLRITQDVEIESAILTFQSQVHLEGNLTIRETGSLQFDSQAASFHSESDRFLKIDGDFHLGAGKPHPENTYYDPAPPSGLSWTIGDPVPMTVMGNYRVDSDAFFYGMDKSITNVHGDFNFDLDKDKKKMDGRHPNIEFVGKEKQMISSGPRDLGNVTINGAGIVLASHVSQAESATLTLSKGIIHSDQYTWTLKNPNIEEDLRGRNNAVTNCDTDENCDRVITGGTRRTHASAGVSRHVKDGISGGTAELSGGYLFPVGGTSGEEAHYRPLILQLEDDLSEAMPATVTPITVPDGATPSWPADNIVTSGGALTLDVYADIFWKVEFKDELDVHPRVRIGAGGLVNVFDQAGIRMVQWDCEWGNAKLAGTSVTANGEESFAENGYVNGVLNLTQETVEIGTCAILGVAANGIENPIHRAEITGGLAEVQIIHNAVLPAPVNVSLDGAPLLSGVGFQTATGYAKLSAGSHEVQLQLVGAPTGQTTDVTLPSLAANKSYAVIAHGTRDNLAVHTIETRLQSSASTMVEAILVHGSGDAPAVNVNVLDPSNSNQLDRVLTRQLAFNETTRYLQLDPDFVNLQVTTADNAEVAVFQLDLAGRQGEALILNLSNVAASLEVYGVDVNGERVAHFNVTSVAEAEELPTEFTLHGNYPNPFNPSTRIQFDLPESAQVSLQIVDMLGREVMTLPAKEFEAGANRSMEVNAVNLASGTYLYRMIATGAESRFVKSGRMTLVK